MAVSAGSAHLRYATIGLEPPRQYLCSLVCSGQDSSLPEPSRLSLRAISKEANR